QAFFLIFGEPMIARHPGIVFIDLAEAVLPIVELAGADADPGKKAGHRDIGLVVPGADEIDDSIADVVRHPATFQISPRFFFNWVCSSMSSERTSFLRCSLASSCSIFFSLAFSTTLGLRPFSKAR